MLRALWCAVAHHFWHELLAQREVARFRLGRHETVQIRHWRCGRCTRSWTEGDPM